MLGWHDMVLCESQMIKVCMTALHVCPASQNSHELKNLQKEKNRRKFCGYNLFNTKDLLLDRPEYRASSKSQT